ncbi:hypothetical protein A33Q_1864 [Indibacter alkaliphilus LW1]|jgi:hypothetical protein|uniref:IPExxxVDY family protein n=1 Tax=Indibacter alkaliphilus (strain CCUG 57479 / KCTC 22604 / LW1) TaxID=1189612 RepID=S2DXT2_INDAL|nr:IPExxxVDY family protein [Indibacter alkaliphilus]EOZ96946.1 hypothetical protein A33Q_1864 [Indibacter alkaliphilus LW1]
MKKIKLIVEHSYDFELLGIVAPLKDYKMAWLLNQNLGLHLVKNPDFRMEFKDDVKIEISRFMEEKEHGFVQLLKNKSLSPDIHSAYLVPELRIMDYFLLLQDHTFELNINAYIERLSQVRLIQNIVKLDISKIKSKENLLTY